MKLIRSVPWPAVLLICVLALAIPVWLIARPDPLLTLVRCDPSANTVPSVLEVGRVRAAREVVVGDLVLGLPDDTNITIIKTHRVKYECALTVRSPSGAQSTHRLRYHPDKLAGRLGDASEVLPDLLPDHKRFIRSFKTDLSLYSAAVKMTPSRARWRLFGRSEAKALLWMKFEMYVPHLRLDGSGLHAFLIRPLSPDPEWIAAFLFDAQGAWRGSLSCTLSEPAAVEYVELELARILTNSRFKE